MSGHYQIPYEKVRVRKMQERIDHLEALLRRAGEVVRKVQYGVNGQCPICARMVLSTQVNVASEHASQCALAALLRDITDAVGGDK